MTRFAEMWGQTKSCGGRQYVDGPATRPLRLGAAATLRRRKRMKNSRRTRMKNLFVGNVKASVLRALAGVAGMGLLGGVGFAQQVTAPAILVGYPDQIIYNAKIATMDDPSLNPTTGRIAQAMAVRQGRILALGTDQEMLQLAGPQT